MLKILAIVIGLIAIITRGTGLVFPAMMKNLVQEIASRRPLIRGVGIVALCLSVLVFLALGNNWGGARLVMAILGILWLAAGFFLILLPAQYAQLLLWFTKRSDQTFRILSAVGVVVGIGIIAVGIACY